ncbi:hypothetical protein DFP72DRAFT_1176731 [Ephemerocybe angulata]|uniref:Uncharacterized protein n=1 Tax=Ephemerocybe angulata TaxID=980116 RepID=A0A8H6HEH5_9AGAR|nr:hypothetical protein DFP72DRAFT_1176731 [Tulosesus angulatus]
MRTTVDLIASGVGQVIAGPISQRSSLTAEVPSKESSGLRIRFLNWFYNTLSHWVRKLTYTNEALKRRAECDTKMKPVIADKLGDRAKDMIYIPLVVTEPESQGRGYSKALLSTVTAAPSSAVRTSCVLIHTNSPTTAKDRLRKIESGAFVTP